MKKNNRNKQPLQAAFTHVLGYISSVSHLTPLMHIVSIFACTFCLYLLVFYMIACFLSTQVFCVRLCLSYIYEAPCEMQCISCQAGEYVFLICLCFLSLLVFS